MRIYTKIFKKYIFSLFFALQIIYIPFRLLYPKLAIISHLGDLSQPVEERNSLAALPQTTQSTVYECSPITIGIRCKEGSLHPYDRITCRERNTRPEEEVPRHASKYNRTTSLESGFV